MREYECPNCDNGVLLVGGMFSRLHCYKCTEQMERVDTHHPEDAPEREFRPQ